MSDYQRPVTAYKRAAELTNSISYMGSIGSMLATGKDTQGRFSVVAFTAKRGNEPPPHFHQWEHEFYYMLEGEIEFHSGAEAFVVKAGEVMFVPQGEAHALYILTPTAHALIMAHSVDERPVGLDRYFIEMGEPATDMRLPSGAITHAMADPIRAIEVAAANGTIILSPEQARQALPNYPGFGIPREHEVSSHPSP